MESVILSSATGFFLTLEHWDLMELRLFIYRTGYPAETFQNYDFISSAPKMSINFQHLIKQCCYSGIINLL